MKVMVAGAWDEKRPEILSYVEELGRGIAEHNWTLITGGGSGIAAAAEHGARLASGTTIAIIGATGKTDSEKNFNQKYTMQIYTNQGWDGRSLIAVKSCDILVVLGGKNGTLLEISAAYLSSIPIVIFKGSSEMIHRFEQFLLDGYIDERHNTLISFIESTEGIITALEQHDKKIKHN